METMREKLARLESGQGGWTKLALAELGVPWPPKKGWKSTLLVQIGEPRNRQPTLVPTGIEAAVCADIAARQKIGLDKYGVTVEENPLPLRAWLEHAYQETLDKAVYLKRAIAEIDRTGKE